jgi:hypothetical protein
VPLTSPHARSFQNFTIDYCKESTIVFVNTYTPTKKWISERQSGHQGEFEGSISITAIGQNAPLLLKSSQLSNTVSDKRNAASKLATLNPKPSLAVTQACTSTTYTYHVAFTCDSGTHLSGELCYLLGDARAGYATMSSVVTACTDIGSNGGGEGGGGGTTTPSVPPGYNPFPNVPAPVSNTRARGQKFAVREDATPCDPVAPPVSTTPADVIEPIRSIRNRCKFKYYYESRSGTKLNTVLN